MDILTDYSNYLSARAYSQGHLHRIRVFLKYCIENNIPYTTQITEKDITNFYISKNYQISTRNCFITAGRNFFGLFLGLPSEKNAWSKMKLMKPEQKIVDFFKEDELNQFINIKYNSKRLSLLKRKVILFMFFYLGIRKAELISLHRNQISLINNSIKIHGKGNKWRFAYLTNELKNLLMNYFKEEPIEINNAFNISLGQINNLFIKISKIFNKRIHPHLFRYSFSHFVMSKGIGIQNLQRLLGHSSVEMSLHYCNPSNFEVEEAYQKALSK